MLTHIYVKNFVLIDQVTLDFSEGMSVLPERPAQENHC